MASVDLKALALLGARARLAELVEEMDALLSSFPELRKEKSRAVTAETPTPEKPARRARKRRKMTPVQREAARERMKKYWEKKKASAK